MAWCRLADSHNPNRSPEQCLQTQSYVIIRPRLKLVNFTTLLLAQTVNGTGRPGTQRLTGHCVSVSGRPAAQRPTGHCVAGHTGTQRPIGHCHRTSVAAVTLDNMAEDTVAASKSLRQIITVSVRYCGPAFVSWLSMLWETLTRNPELQWFGISPQFRLKVSRGDEGVGDVCFPGDEGVGRPWRGYRCVQMNVEPAWYLKLLLNLGLCIYFWIPNPM